MPRSTAHTILTESLPVAYEGEDLYRRLSSAPMYGQVPYRRARKRGTYAREFIHRSKNGIYDPLTFYHLLDTVMTVRVGVEWRTSALLAQLRASKPQLVWDATTVGRVLSDIADGLSESYAGFDPIIRTKRWNGMSYAVSDHPEAHLALFRLLEDLIPLCEAEIQWELDGAPQKRMASPLERCPSII